jgi:hypothetical protein
MHGGLWSRAFAHSLPLLKDIGKHETQNLTLNVKEGDKRRMLSFSDRSGEGKQYLVVVASFTNN